MLKMSKISTPPVVSCFDKAISPPYFRWSRCVRYLLSTGSDWMRHPRTKLNLLSLYKLKYLKQWRRIPVDLYVRYDGWRSCMSSRSCLSARLLRAAACIFISGKYRLETVRYREKYTESRYTSTAVGISERTGTK